MGISAEKRIFSLRAAHGQGSVNLQWQPGEGGLLAITGSNSTVGIYDRHGQQKDSLKLPGFATGFSWNVEGNLLGIITDKSPTLFLWNSSSHKTEQVDTGLRDSVSLLTWAKNSPTVAIGTSRGNLLLYNYKTTRKIPILGKHSRRISCGAWSDEGVLALGSEDRTLTITSPEGDTLQTVPLRAEPAELQFSEMKMDERAMGQNTVSVVIAKRNLFLLNLNDPDNPIELTFQQKYGAIVTYSWFGDGYILLGFSAGYFVVISTHMKEIGQELFQIKNHRERLTNIALCHTINKAASCGDNTVKIHELKEWKETVGMLTIEEETLIDSLVWSQDGRLLAVGGTSGNVHVFLTRLPMMAQCNHGRVAVLTSLREISVYGDTEKGAKVVKTEVEPSFLALGPNHVAAGFNNRVWIYSLGDQSTAEQPRFRQYMFSVQSMFLSEDFASVLMDKGKLLLHELNGEGDEKSSRMFPDKETQNVRINCHALSKDFLIYATDTGDLVVFSLEEWKHISEYRHTCAWKKVFPDPAGIQILAIDERSQCFCFNPVSDQLVRVPEFLPKCEGILWDSLAPARNIFIAYDGEVLEAFIFRKDNIQGLKVSKVGQANISNGQLPLLFQGPEITVLTAGAKLTSQIIPCLDVVPSSVAKPEAKAVLEKLVSLEKYHDAWRVCEILNSTDDWIQLAEAALKSLEIALAIRIYKRLGDVGMVFSLESISEVEDANLLAGHIAMLLGNVTLAQELYLKSSQPQAAFEMQCDVMHWEEALALAKQYAPQRVPFLSKEYAQQLESMGDFATALVHFEKALHGLVNEGLKDDLAVCRAGLARTAIRCGDIRRGLSLVQQIDDKVLCRQCAEALEETKNWNEAAVLYEKTGHFEKAAALYVRLKNWSKVGELIDHVTSPSIQLQYAKAKEAEGKHKEALKAYETARDFESAISLCLGKLNNPQDAIRIARESKSVDGAKLIAKFFMKLGDYAAALEYLVLSQCHEAAFEVAQQHGQMALYAEILGDQARPEDYLQMALHFEREQNAFLAGKFYALAGQEPKAIKWLLKAAQAGSDEDKALSLATKIIGSSQNEQLVSQLTSFLRGEVDGIPRDGKYLFRVYISRRQYKEAAKTAVIIASEEQNAGNYRDAHDLLLHMYQELSQHAIHIPHDMEQNLMLLHSYVLVRIQVKRGDHTKAARMLLRVAESISKFPAHVVPILTSTVIECDRAGLKKSAFQYASMLLRPEYREFLDPKYKKKVEAIVRKPPKGEINEEAEITPCPYCQYPVMETSLSCSQCKNTLPYCIATGNHVVANDLTRCPSCRFYAIRSEFLSVLQIIGNCPMCGTAVNLEDVKTIKGLDRISLASGSVDER